MNPDELQQLLKKRESETLEFKREWYKIDATDQDTKAHSQGELVKDILALANGNTNSVGKTAYLIIGASDTFNSDGVRDLFDVERNIDIDQVHKIVNKCIDPPLDSLSSERVIPPDGDKSLIVISVGPSSHLHETIQQIKAKERSYDERMALIRHNDKVRAASMEEREVIKKLKEVWDADSKNVSPVLSGIIVGGVVGGLITTALGRGDQPLSKAIAGTLVGALLGFSLGTMYSDVRWFRTFLYRLPPRWRLPTAILAFIAATAIGYGINLLFRSLGAAR